MNLALYKCGRLAHRFTGKERDSESGLDYFGARYYGSALGRFTSVDPDPGDFDLGETGGRLTRRV